MLSSITHSDCATFNSFDLKKQAANELAYKKVLEKLEDNYSDLKPFATWDLVRSCVRPMSDFIETIDDWMGFEDEDDPRKQVVDYAQAWYKWETDGLVGDGEEPFVPIILKAVFKPEEDEPTGNRWWWGLDEADFEPNNKWPACSNTFECDQEWIVLWKDLIDLLVDEKREAERASRATG
jgi:hypothetical protein